jgi:tRNA(fMet)-specific endonuclease VapC
VTYLIDTDVVADWLKGIQTARALLPTLQPAGIAISLITVGEILEGIYFGASTQAHAAGFRHFLRGVDVLPANRRIMERFARIRGDLRRRGLIIGDFDILIAATALRHNLILVTRNTRHFSRVPSLRIL